MTRYEVIVTSDTNLYAKTTYHFDNKVDAQKCFDKYYILRGYYPYLKEIQSECST